MRLLLSVWVFFTCLCIALAGGAVAKPSDFAFYITGPDAGREAPGTLLRLQRMALPPLYRAKAWRILYATRDFRGLPMVSSGIVVLPDKAASRRGQQTIVGWAHPTSGVARHCAPSIQSTALQAIPGLNDLVAAGHVVAATDYPGLGTAGRVGYLVGRGQAQAVLDSVRAAQQIPEVGRAASVALWGYSQGAHAVLFAAGIQPGYAPEIKLAGIAAVAPPTMLARLFVNAVGTPEGRILSSYAFGAWSAKYGIPMDGLVDADVEEAIATLNRNCVLKPGDLLNVLSAQRALEKKFFNSDPLKDARWARVIAGNSLSSLPGRVPAFIAQGMADTIVLPAVTTTFVRSSCRSGAAITYVLLQGKGHSASNAAAQPQALAWLNSRLAGNPASSNCR